MRFIRKGGRVIPIRDKNELGKTGEKVALSGIAIGFAGKAALDGGRVMAHNGFQKAVAAAHHFGMKSGQYLTAKSTARAGAKIAAGGKKALFAGGALYLGGLAAMGIGAFRTRKK